MLRNVDVSLGEWKPEIDVIKIDLEKNTSDSIKEM